MKNAYNLTKAVTEAGEMVSVFASPISRLI